MSAFAISFVREATMPHYEVHQDWETGEQAGASGMFQVIDLQEINDSESIDRTYLINQGNHYHSLDELTKDISIATGISVDEITIEEV